MTNPANDTHNSSNEMPIVIVVMNDNNGRLFNNYKKQSNHTAQCDITTKIDINYHRWQIPLRAAFATTTHKILGSTAKGNCVTMPSESSPWLRGLDYVASSRAKDLTKLFLLELGGEETIW
jgi:ATP-dependent exoDNAse (exonuclease V) alpha subunit